MHSLPPLVRPRPRWQHRSARNGCSAPAGESADSKQGVTDRIPYALRNVGFVGLAKEVVERLRLRASNFSSGYASFIDPPSRGERPERRQRDGDRERGHRTASATTPASTRCSGPRPCGRPARRRSRNEQKGMPVRITHEKVAILSGAFEDDPRGNDVVASRSTGRRLATATRVSVA